METDFGLTTYGGVAPHVAKIMQNRPETRNAQKNRLTYDLNAGLDRAAQDEAIKVVLPGGEGPHFSSGHDLRSFGKLEDPLVGTWKPSTDGGVHSRYSLGPEVFLGMDNHRFRAPRSRRSAWPWPTASPRSRRSRRS